MRRNITTSGQTINGDRFDWSSAYRRLAAVLDRIEHGEAQGAERTQQILRARAIAYAKQTTQTDHLTYLDGIVFEIDRKRFALKLDNGVAAVPLAGLMVAPGLPSFYLGLINHRGNIFPVIDIRPLIGAARQEGKALRFAILIKNGGHALGLAASEVMGIERLRSDQIAAAVTEGASHRALLGIGPNETSIVDGTLLMQDIRLLVDDQPRIAFRKQGETS